MKTNIKTWLSGFLMLAAIALPLSVQAGKIVVNHDEWTTTNTGFTTAGGINDPGVFMDNVVRWFTGGGNGTVHAYSNNFAYNASSPLGGALNSAGHTYTFGTGITFDLPTLQTYDAIFLGGDQPPGSIAAYSSILIDYVNMGGNVYLSGGTGVGGAAAEATRWNTFLDAFGLSYAPVYNGQSASRAINNPHPIFANVDHLYDNNGNSITDEDLADPRNQVLVSSGNDGLYAIWDSSLAVPEPTTLLLLGVGLTGLGFARRRLH